MYLAAARAEIAWLKREPAAVLEATEEALDLAIRADAAWTVGELAYWRWRAGIVEEIPARAAEPYTLSIRGDWRRAAECWTELGCPYEAALALADADDEELCGARSMSCSSSGLVRRRQSSPAASASGESGACHGGRGLARARIQPA